MFNWFAGVSLWDALITGWVCSWFWFGLAWALVLGFDSLFVLFREFSFTVDLGLVLIVCCWFGLLAGLENLDLFFVIVFSGFAFVLLLVFGF